MAAMRTRTAIEAETRSEPEAESEAEPRFVVTTFDACASFAAAVDGSPVCDACGWLLGDHPGAIADVRTLPGAVRVQPQPRPNRLAS
jgi:hypothetical protein